MNKIPDIRIRQIGIGLVELLIALVLALVLTMGIIEVFLGSKQAYRTQDALSRIQENGRFAMEELSRNIRMAGFQGCGKMDSITPNVVANGFPGGDQWSTNAVRGYKYNGSNFNPAYSGTEPSPLLANTDVVSITHVINCDAYLDVVMADDGAAVDIKDGNSCNFEQGDPVIITDCTTTDLFRVSNVVDPASVTLAHAQGAEAYENTDNRLSRAYGADARVYQLVRVDYYLKQNNFGQPALFKRVNGVESELVEGVEDFQVLFGEDTGTDFFVDEYRDATAVTDWAKVSSVRPVVSLRSKTDNITLIEDSVRNDKRLRHDMTSTIGIRNRLP